MNINVSVNPIIINVTVTEEPFGVKYENVTVSGLAVRELQTVREISGTSSTVKAERLLASKSFSDNAYFVTISETIKGDPISLFVHLPDQDAELLTTFNVSGNRIEFLSFEDIDGLFVTIKYLY